MKASGAELRAFYSEWPVGDDYYQDDGFETNDHGELMHLHPEEQYDVVDVIGYFVWQGNGDVPRSIEINGVIIDIPVGWNGPDTTEVFEAWRDGKTVASVRIKSDQFELFRKVCVMHGWEVV